MLKRCWNKPLSVDIWSTWPHMAITDEWGWGTSFHFSPLLPGKSIAASEAAHEARIGALLNLAPGKKALDAGCGVGGPMRTIAACTGAQIVGLTINDYQVERATHHNKQVTLTTFFLCQSCAIGCSLIVVFVHVSIAYVSYGTTLLIVATHSLGWRASARWCRVTTLPSRSPSPPLMGPFPSSPPATPPRYSFGGMQLHIVATWWF